MVALFVVLLGLYLWAGTFPDTQYKVVSISEEPSFWGLPEQFVGYEAQVAPTYVPRNPLGVDFIKRWGILLILVPGWFTLGLTLLLGQTIWRKIRLEVNW
jgi:hypothetical protein